MTTGGSTQSPIEAALPMESGSFGPSLQPCHMLVPKNKAQRNAPALEEFERQIGAAFGGYTTIGETSGVWFDASGMRWEDHCVVYMVAIPWREESRAALRQAIETLAMSLGEQCIFLMVGTTRTFLIASPWSNPEGEQRQEGTGKAN